MSFLNNGSIASDPLAQMAADEPTRLLLFSRVHTSRSEPFYLDETKVLTVVPDHVCPFQPEGFHPQWSHDQAAVVAIAILHHLSLEGWFGLAPSMAHVGAVINALTDEVDCHPVGSSKAIY